MDAVHTLNGTIAQPTAHRQRHLQTRPNPGPRRICQRCSRLAGAGTAQTGAVRAAWNSIIAQFERRPLHWRKIEYKEREIALIWRGLVDLHLSEAFRSIHTVNCQWDKKSQNWVLLKKIKTASVPWIFQIGTWFSMLIVDIWNQRPEEHLKPTGGPTLNLSPDNHNTSRPLRRQQHDSHSAWYQGLEVSRSKNLRHLWRQPYIMAFAQNHETGSQPRSSITQSSSLRPPPLSEREALLCHFRSGAPSHYHP